MSREFPSVEMLLGKKRRRLSAGGGFKRGEEVWSEEMEAILEALVKEGDLGMLSGAFERVVVKQKTESEKALFLEKSACFGVQLHKEADKLMRQQASLHNLVAWSLTQDLTVKVFSLLGTRCLCQVAASCTLFYNLTLDPACYVDMDLTMRGAVSRVGDRTVTKLVQRAGHNLRSLKLGALPLQNRIPGAVSNAAADGLTEIIPVDLSSTPNRFFPPSCMAHDRDILTRDCLESLISNHGIAGTLLTKLHLFNLDKMESGNLCRALAACPCLTDLEVVGLRVILQPLIECLGSHCPKLNRLCSQTGGLKPDWSDLYANYAEECLEKKSCNQLIKGCSDLSHLALRGYGVTDKRANLLLKGLPKLTVIDFCGALKLTGSFLRGLFGRGIVGGGYQPSQLETILLRDCQRLKEAEVERFLFMLIGGECKNLRHLDISSKGGLAARDWFDKRLSPSTEQAILRVRQQRTELCLLAEFPDQKSESGSMSDSLDDSDDSGPLGPTYSSDSSTNSESSDDLDLAPRRVFRDLRNSLNDLERRIHQLERSPERS